MRWRICLKSHLDVSTSTQKAICYTRMARLMVLAPTTSLGFNLSSFTTRSSPFIEGSTEVVTVEDGIPDLDLDILNIVHHRPTMVGRRTPTRPIDMCGCVEAFQQFSADALLGEP